MIGAMDPAEQPITLVPSRGDEWSRWFTVMAETVRDAVPEAAVEHIGSTAVPGLAAKDVVDLLVGVAADDVVHVARLLAAAGFDLDRKSTRLNSSHVAISYAVFCLKKKKSNRYN